MSNVYSLSNAHSSRTPVATNDRARAVDPRPGLRLTRRGRVVFTMLFLGLVTAVMIFVGARAVASFEPSAPLQVRYVEVSAGDTLYSIAGEYAAPGQVQDLVFQIEELNSMPNSDIFPGQRLAIPVQ
ncbi:MAG TPA: LysM peptidoglycan-binding domain-containing protein [Marmoricola sp.]|nr:LysM peptidoglycan-binding domain-containing protein [Marmoricola sp.]